MKAVETLLSFFMIKKGESKEMLHQLKFLFQNCNNIS